MLGQLFLPRVSYAIHVLCFMARTAPQDRLATAPELSSWLRRRWPGISETYLATVVRLLARAGILRSRRGYGGGYDLARPATEITLRDVVQALQTAEADGCPLTPAGRCPCEEDCDSYRQLRSLDERCSALLADVTIADLAYDMQMDEADEQT